MCTIHDWAPYLFNFIQELASDIYFLEILNFYYIFFEHILMHVCMHILGFFAAYNTRGAHHTNKTYELDKNY